MLRNLALAALCLCPHQAIAHDVSGQQEHLSAASAAPAKKVAIIGAGAGGASAAFHLSQYAAAAGIPTNITVFEREGYIGGRSTVVHAWDAPSVPVELGATIFVAVNHILMDAVARFNLSTLDYGPEYPDTADAEAGDEEEGSYVGVWDGHGFVFTGRDDMGWWDKAKLLWRYGMAPIRTVRLMKKTVGAFLKMYDEPHFPWPSLSDKAHELGLVEASAATGDEFLRKNGVGELFAHDIIQASTRVNYAQNLALVNGLITMVCMATEGAMSVTGGNWQIFADMVSSATKDVRLNTSVSALEKHSDGTYTLTSKNTTTATASVSSSSSEHFDSVILAAPYQFADLTISPQRPQHVPDNVPYVSLHVTLLASPHRLSPAAFNLPPGARVPNVILTTLPPGVARPPNDEPSFAGDAGFFSISTLRTARNPNHGGRKEYLYKIFSPAPVTGAFLAKVFGLEQEGEGGGAFGRNDDEEGGSGPGEFPREAVSWIHRKVWHSYPYEFPRVTFEEVRLDEGLWYTSGIEGFISTMETSALAGKNVARLVVDGWVEEGEGKGKVGEEGVGYDEL